MNTTIRQVIATHIPEWDGRPVSWAWAAPGKFYVIPGTEADDIGGGDWETGAQETAHEKWAARHLHMDDGGKACAKLLHDGWVRLVTPFDIESAKPVIDRRTVPVLLQAIIQNIHQHGLNPETEGIIHGFEGGYHASKVAEFVKKHGGREWEDKLFAGLL